MIKRLTLSTLFLASIFQNIISMETNNNNIAQSTKRAAEVEETSSAKKIKTSTEEGSTAEKFGFYFRNAIIAKKLLPNEASFLRLMIYPFREYNVNEEKLTIDLFALEPHSSDLLKHHEKSPPKSVAINGDGMYSFPLFTSLYMGNVSFFEDLVERGADVTTLRYGNNLLFEAVTSMSVRTNHLEKIKKIIDILLAHEKKSSLLNQQGINLYTNTTSSKKHQPCLNVVVSFLEKTSTDIAKEKVQPIAKSIMYSLLANGENPYLTDYNGQSAIDIAYEKKNNKLVQSLKSRFKKSYISSILQSNDITTENPCEQDKPL